MMHYICKLDVYSLQVNISDLSPHLYRSSFHLHNQYPTFLYMQHTMPNTIVYKYTHVSIAISNNELY